MTAVARPPRRAPRRPAAWSCWPGPVDPGQGPGRASPARSRLRAQRGERRAAKALAVGRHGAGGADRGRAARRQRRGAVRRIGRGDGVRADRAWRPAARGTRVHRSSRHAFPLRARSEARRRARAPRGGRLGGALSRRSGSPRCAGIASPTRQPRRGHCWRSPLAIRSMPLAAARCAAWPGRSGWPEKLLRRGRIDHRAHLLDPSWPGSRPSRRARG